jgi:hypothetical protein
MASLGWSALPSSLNVTNGAWTLMRSPGFAVELRDRAGAVAAHVGQRLVGFDLRQDVRLTDLLSDLNAPLDQLCFL